MKLKEANVRDHVKAAFPQFEWVCNRQVGSGNSRKIPDMMADMGSHVIFIEIDELQHQGRGYNEDSERERMMQLMSDMGMRPTVFIRFNPDDYGDSTGNKITSCWGVDSKGVGRVKPSKETEWQTRLTQLCEQVQARLPVPTVDFEVVHLFYDMQSCA